MRLSDLLHCTVHDADGTVIGRVSDLRLVQDGPVVGGLQAAIRVDALVVGRAGLAERLGYVRSRVNGPWMLKVLFSHIERRARIVPAHEIESWDITSGVLRVGRRDAAIRPLEDA